MQKIFAPYVKEILASLGEPLIYVDVGARNGMFELAGIAPFVKAYGFEPNPEEFVKLERGDTDVSWLGVAAPRYAQSRYAPYAISNVDGTRTFYVTKGPGAAGMIEPNIERLREIIWKGMRYYPNFGDQVFPVKEVIPVETKTLASFAREGGLNWIDFLKIDVEGMEYEVLEGAGNLLRSTAVIKVEVCFIPFRKNQKLFSHVDLLLRNYGFDLLKFETTQGQVGYKERESHFSIGPAIGWPDRYGQALSCDAIYVNRDLMGPRAAAQAVVLIEKNYLDEALFILKRKTDIRNEQLFELLKNWRGGWKTWLFDAFIALFLKAVSLRRPWKSFRRWLGWRKLRRAGRVPPVKPVQRPVSETTESVWAK
ncbi:MAG: FkbM family methyltransferase [Candidatus Omnitrophica bacterium]|nr:FkbM family methyltransferase [Candidatus Omnitrophota bacterium]